MEDLYAALDLSRDASTDEVRAAYRRASKRAHPDKGGKPEQWALVSLAKDVLGDERRREKYDKTGRVDDALAGVAESRPMNLAMEAVAQAMAEADRHGRDFESVDLVDNAKAYLSKKLRERKEMRAAKQKAVKKGLAVAKRFSAKKGKTNRIGLMIEAQARDMERGIEVDDNEIVAIEAATKILAEHDYACEKAETNSLRVQMTANGFQNFGFTSV